MNHIDSIFISIIGIIIIGIIDSLHFPKNELFAHNWTSLLTFAFYTIDFFSDVFFSMRLYLYAININDDEFDSITDNYYSWVFIASIIFLVIPLAFNIGQLQIEFNKWEIGPILDNAHAREWIKDNLMLLSVLVIIYYYIYWWFII